MKNNEYDLDQDDDQPIEDIKLDVSKVKNLIPSYNSEKLCEMIVTNRYFNFHEDITVACMEELGKRRVAGDTFLFEKYIEECAAKLPKLNFKMPDLRDILQQAVGTVGRVK